MTLGQNLASEEYQPYMRNTLASLADGKAAARGLEQDRLNRISSLMDYGGQYETNRLSRLSGNRTFGANRDDTGYGQRFDERGFRTNTTNTRYGRLADLAGIGQSATTQGISAGNQMSSLRGNAIQGIGDAKASGHVGTANAWSNSFSNLSSLAGDYAAGQRWGAARSPSGGTPIPSRNNWGAYW